MSKLTTAKDIYRSEGILKVGVEVIDHLYEKSIGSMLPRQWVEYNGIEVRAAHRGDSILPFRDYHRPNYESGIAAGLRDHLTNRDTVVIVGGGWGVTASIAGRQVGENGQVIVYEGSRSQVERIKETIRRNGVEDRIEVKHTIVAEEISLRGDSEGADKLSPSDLPDCDLLELDCEGAEIEILRNSRIEPDTILVETHGFHGAPSDEVASLLEQTGYMIVSKAVADEGKKRYCEVQDVHAMTAVKRSCS
jgi:hypothetical protein